MKRALFSFILIFVLHFLGHSQDLAANVFEKSVPAGTIENDSKQEPFLFEENLGQVRDTEGNKRPDILFTAQSQGMNVYLRKNGLSFVFSQSYKGDPIELFEEMRINEHEQMFETLSDMYRVDLEFIGASMEPSIQKQHQSESYKNFYKGQSEDWIENIRSYGEVWYENLYPNIDLKLYAKDGGIKYDIVVHPGGNVDDIQMRFNGGKSKILKDGSLSVSAPLGELLDDRPVALQGDSIDIEYSLKKQIVSFEVGDYNEQATLLIDPFISWVSYFGGSDIDRPQSMEIGVDLYYSGVTHSSDIPISAGLINDSLSSADDVLICCFSRTGEYLWSTLIGSSQTEYIEGAGIEYYNEGLYICGSTHGEDFPTTESTLQEEMSTEGISEGFISKIKPDGTLEWSTYFGGNGSEIPSDVEEFQGKLLICGLTGSNDSYFEDFGDWEYSRGFILTLSENGVLQDLNIFRADGTLYLSSIQSNDTLVVCSGNTYGQIDAAFNGHSQYHSSDSDGFIIIANENLSIINGTYINGMGFQNHRPQSLCLTENGDIWYGMYGPEPVYDSFVTSNHIQDLSESYFGTGWQAHVSCFNLHAEILYGSYLTNPGDNAIHSISRGPLNSVYISMNSDAPQDQFFDSWLDHNLENPLAPDGRLIHLDSEGNALFHTYFGGEVSDIFKKVIYEDDALFGVGQAHGSLPTGSVEPFDAEHNGEADWFMFAWNYFPVFYDHSNYGCFDGFFDISISALGEFENDNTFILEFSENETFETILLDYEISAFQDTTVNIALNEALLPGDYKIRVRSTSPSNLNNVLIDDVTIEEQQEVFISDIPPICADASGITIASENDNFSYGQPSSGQYINSDLEFLLTSSGNTFCYTPEEKGDYELLYVFENSCSIDSAITTLSFLDDVEATPTSQLFCAGEDIIIELEAFEPLGGTYIFEGDTITSIIAPLMDSTLYFTYAAPYNDGLCETIQEVSIDFITPESIQTSLPQNICFDSEPILIEANLELLTFESELLSDYLFNPEEWDLGLNILNVTADNGCGIVETQLEIFIDSLEQAQIYTDTICYNFINDLEVEPPGGEISAYFEETNLEFFDLENLLDGSDLYWSNVYSDFTMYYAFTNACGTSLDSNSVYFDHLNALYLEENYAICSGESIDLNDQIFGWEYTFQSEFVDEMGVFDSEETETGDYLIPYYYDHQCFDSPIVTVSVEGEVQPSIEMADTLCAYFDAYDEFVTNPQGGQLDGDGVNSFENVFYPSDVQELGENEIIYIFTNTCGTYYDTAIYELLPIPSSTGIFQDGNTLEAFLEGEYYEWEYEGQLIEGQNEQSLMGIGTGDYRVRYRDEHCWSLWSNEMSFTIGIDALEKDPGFVVYPNPSNGQFTIEVSPDMIGEEFKIYDYLGKLVFETTIHSLISKFEPDLTKGMYVSRINVFSQKVLLK